MILQIQDCVRKSNFLLTQSSPHLCYLSHIIFSFSTIPSLHNRVFFLDLESLLDPNWATSIDITVQTPHILCTECLCTSRHVLVSYYNCFSISLKCDVQVDRIKCHLTLIINPFQALISLALMRNSFLSRCNQN